MSGHLYTSLQAFTSHVEQVQIVRKWVWGGLHRPQDGHEEPGLSALALVPAQQTSGQGAEQTGLLEEVGALRGLLARVAPQLEDLAGVKQQMAQLVSVLLPGDCPIFFYLSTLHDIYTRQVYNASPGCVCCPWLMSNATV